MSYFTTDRKKTAIIVYRKNAVQKLVNIQYASHPFSPSAILETFVGNKNANAI
jgi:hypothetical protein